MYSIGYDVGSSSIKAALIGIDNGKILGISAYPEQEMTMIAHHEGWAEQNPQDWWEAVCLATKALLHQTGVLGSQITSIGISYQMHGLVMVDKHQNVLRPSIIWCDSRAVMIGENALQDLGREYCYGHLLNSPGNFTASKLRWVQENEQEVYEKIDKIMLPGDYIAMKLTGESTSTISGLSEGILWDFKNYNIADKLLDHYNIDKGLIPDIKDTFSHQGSLHEKAASETGLVKGIPVTYRAGDQPNNALSLGVLNPGDIAATGGTSGVVYGISEDVIFDPNSRINSFAHVNHQQDVPRIGQLLCINGAGSQYAWIRSQLAPENTSYFEMEQGISNIPVGSEGLRIIPFGNGAERMLKNQQTGAHYCNVQFNIHTREHFYRAALEGIAFSFIYGIKILETVGIHPRKLKVGNDNLFQSKVFSQTISNLLNCEIQMIETTGAVGAAQASCVATGHYNSVEEAVSNQILVKKYTPDSSNKEQLDIYKDWSEHLSIFIKSN